jgi:GNAT superfamily N-acetyltransferase
VRIDAEPFSRWMGEAADAGLFEAHWREVGEHLHDIPLEPDFKQLLMAERAGVLASFTLREDPIGEEPGALRGYAMMMCSTHLFYRSHLFAYSHALYVAPERRGHGLELIRTVEREMRGRGVKKAFFLIKRGTEYGAIFERLGYEPGEEAWGKLL